MDADVKHMIAGQFGAAIAMLENAMIACPEALWDAGAPDRQFGYLAYHTIFWLEYDLAEAPGAFVPNAPFTLGELDPAGVYPAPLPTKAELLSALARGRRDLRIKLDTLTDAQLGESGASMRLGLTRGAQLLYSMRHVQHHVAQLHWMLRERGGVEPPRWVGSSDPHA